MRQSVFVYYVQPTSPVFIERMRLMIFKITHCT